LWAANVTLYELLTLAPPFTAEDTDALMTAIQKGRWLPARQHRPDIPPKLEAVLIKGFEKKLKNRFHSAAEFAAALSGHFDANIGNPLAIAAVVRGLFG
jgi:serine/threonine protein kinase